MKSTCLALVEITHACQLDCPVCFAGPSLNGDHLTLAQIEAMMDRLLACEGEPESLQLSGGEPTLHPKILDVLRLASEKGFRRVLLNTNGLRLANDPAFLDAVAAYDPTIYLQFDGLEDATYRTLRGRDLVGMKLRLVEMLAERKLRTVLVSTVVRGVNEHELGRLVDYALEQRHVRALTLQPATFSGRFAPDETIAPADPMDRVTLAECATLIAAQSQHGFRAGDFFPIPCPDPACSLVTYVHTGADPETGQQRVLPLTRLADAEDYIDFVKNASAGEMNGQLREVFEEFISAGAAEGRTDACACSACGGVEIDWGALELEITLIGMMHFMDEHTFDLARARKCCVHEVLPDDGGIVPFCIYNVLHRGR
ncbi:MAG TPA: radical SAM protein [Thermoleophilia bacterium]|nr:radical SAM protein [Thermoleophilia bacterium]